MHPKSHLPAIFVGITLLASQVVAPTLAQKGVAPNSTPKQGTSVLNIDTTPTISEEQATKKELSASEAKIQQFVNEDIIEEVPVSQQEFLAVTKNFRQRAVQQALGQVGYKEHPLGSNCNKFSRYLGKGCQPWCADFVSWAFDSTGNHNKRVDWGNPSAVASILQWAKSKKHLVTTPQPGDIFLEIGNGVSHTGLVRSVGRGTFTTVEGNSSNKVRSVKRTLSKRYRFVRVPSHQ